MLDYQGIQYTIMKFIFKSIDEDGTVTIKQSESVVLLDEAVDLASDFLRGCGYYFEQLEVVKEPPTEENGFDSEERRSVYLQETSFDR